jgi:hypothetical protein
VPPHCRHQSATNCFPPDLNIGICKPKIAVSATYVLGISNHFVYGTPKRHMYAYSRVFGKERKSSSGIVVSLLKSPETEGFVPACPDKVINTRDYVERYRKKALFL